MERPLTKQEELILNAVYEKYGKSNKDKIFFIKEDESIGESELSACITVWGDSGNGPFVHLTNVASFLDKNLMTINEIKETQI